LCERINEICRISGRYLEGGKYHSQISYMMGSRMAWLKFYLHRLDHDKIDYQQILLATIRFRRFDIAIYLLQESFVCIEDFTFVLSNIYFNEDIANFILTLNDDIEFMDRCIARVDNCVTNRQWINFFSQYIKKVYGDVIGDIKEQEWEHKMDLKEQDERIR